MNNFYNFVLKLFDLIKGDTKADKIAILTLKNKKIVSVKYIDTEDELKAILD